MRTADHHQPTHLAVRRHLAHLGPTPRTQVPSLAHRPMTRTQADRTGDRQPRRETHHHQIRRRRLAPATPLSTFRNGIQRGFQTCCSSHRRCGRLNHFPHQIVVMRFIERDAEFPARLFGDEAADFQFGGEGDDADPDLSRHECC